MAKVSLRIYNREIETLVDQSHTNEAIAHCHHILRTFPKHLATYRLLGKAYLEAKRYTEAVDVFSRVLMSVPDDFVSHVGMSIICDEERKMDDAIWHMERAYETQSANAAIQGELQRLYGRRDGMEPPRIRMTRGALANLYVQGELYPQAIAEIRAVLAQESDRADMQVLLARAYFRSGQKADASDMCAQLLKRYLYCFDANRIMVDLLPGTAMAESTQVYRMRVGELDPYATFAKGSVFLSHEVPDASISLERLEYKGGEEPAQPWTPSLGAGTAASAVAAGVAASEPDWLKSASSNVTPPAPQAEEGIPDFLRQAGWGTSTGPEQPTSIFDEESASGGLTPAEIPDWLKGQEPVNAVPAPVEPAQAIDIPDWLMDNNQAGAKDEAVPDWLKGSSQTPAEPEPMDATSAWLSGLEEKPQATEPAKVPDWLNEVDKSEVVESAPAGDVPDWLGGLDKPEAVESAPAEDVPDWLGGLDKPEAVESAPAEDVPDWLSGLDKPEAVESAPAGDVPDWLNGLDKPEALESAETPEWLGGLDKPQEAEPVSLPDWLSESAPQAAEPATLPDWLSGLDSQAQEPIQPTPAVESLGASAQEQDDAVAWLESLAAKHGAKPEELVTDPNKRSEKPPEWVSQAQNLGQETPAPQTPAASVESLGASAQEQDDAVAWLESLAAKHGAKPEELVTDPNKRNEKPPEWVSQAQNLGQEAPVPQTPAASVESLGASAQEQDDAVAWLESLAAKHGAKPEELVTDPNKRSEKPPEWVSQAQSIGEAQPAQPEQKPEVVENALNIGEQFFAEFENALTAEPITPAADETSAWLQDLAAEEEKQVQPSSEIPDWLSEDQPSQAAGEQLESAEQQAETQKSDLPDWLSDIEEKDAKAQDETVSENVPQGDLANWLNSLDDEPGLPFESLPTPDSILFESQSAAKSKGREPAGQKSDLPDWLSGVESAEIEAEDEWKPPTAAQAEAEPLPAWLQEETEEEEESAPAYSEDDDTPPWQHREKWEAGEPQELQEAQEPQYPTPTSPSDWHPLEPKQAPAKPVAPPKQEAPAEQKAFVPPPPLPAAMQQPPAAPEAAIPAKKKLALPARKQPEPANAIVALNQAKGELDRGDIPAALAHYGKLIKKGKHIEETIRDLTESIYRYPVEVGIWQTLGDAYMRANRLKEALEAYNKAEELIR